MTGVYIFLSCNKQRSSLPGRFSRLCQRQDRDLCVARDVRTWACRGSTRGRATCGSLAPLKTVGVAGRSLVRRRADVV